MSQFTGSLSELRDRRPEGPGHDRARGSGIRQYRFAAATANGILVSNTPGVLDDTTADHAFALMLATARRVPDGDAFVRSGQWKRWNLELNIGLDVHHRTLGFWAWGASVKRLPNARAAFRCASCTITAHGWREIENELKATWVEKDQLMREADFISIHVPLNDSTRHLIGEAELRAMKPTAILVNTARGPVSETKRHSRKL